MHPRLPAELQEIILDATHDDFDMPTSLICSLVSHDWNRRSRLYNFHTLDLAVWRVDPKLETLLSLLESPVETISAVVKTMRVRSAQFAAFPALVEVTKAKLVNVVTLVMCIGTPQVWSKLIHRSYPRPQRSITIQELPELNPRTIFPAVTSLTIEWCFVIGSAPHNQRVLDFICAFERLTTLSFSYDESMRSYYGSTVETTQVPQIRSSSTVKTLSFSMSARQSMTFSSWVEQQTDLHIHDLTLRLDNVKPNVRSLSFLEKQGRYVRSLTLVGHGEPSQLSQVKL